VSPNRSALAPFLITLSFILLTPAAAHAGASVSAGSSFPASTVVGAAGVPASVTLTNANTSPDTTLTLCNVGDVAGCDGTEGITVVPSCGGLDFTASCISPDSGVFSISSPSFGAAGSACDGMQFTTSIINPTTGKVRFMPTGGQHIVLPSPGSYCRILLTVGVISFPDIDAQPVTPGLQTVQIVEALGFSNGGLLTFGRGSSGGVTVKGAPSIAASASAGVTIGGQVTASATLTGEYDPTAGNVTFDLYGPGDASCSGTAAYSSTVPIQSDGTAAPASFTPTTAGTYRWVASYAGDTNNDPATSACANAGAAVTVGRIAPTVATVASAGIAIGGQVTSTATLAGEHNPSSGNVTFTLYDPGDAACAAAPAFTSTVAVNADGTASPGAFTPTTAGAYSWVAEYAGDVNNQPAASDCHDIDARVTIAKANPSITSSASAGVAIGGQVSNAATLVGEHNPTNGNVTFKLYGPDDLGCSGTVVFESTAAVSSGGTATSASYTPTAPGLYRWVASHGGDANNEATSGACNDPGSKVTVVRAAPALTANASASVSVGGSLTDAITLSGEHNPTGGSVQFKLYGPDDATCARAAVLTETVSIANDGTVTSPAYVTAAPGVHSWVASYSGDASNVAAAGACGDAGQSVTVTKASPAIVMNASGSVAVGGAVTNAVALQGEFHPTTGNVTLRLYAPGDTTCAGAAVFQSTVAVDGDGTATSQPYSPSSPGTYRWVAGYAGDANNAASNGACNDPGGNVAVTKASPSMTTNASPAVPVGGVVSDSANLAGEFGPTSGTVTFALYAPGDASCAGTPVLRSTVAINADGTATSGSFTADAAGTYRWVAIYSGDANNVAAAGACDDANEQVAVGKVTPAVVSAPSPAATVGDAVAHSISLNGEHSPVTGTITFRLYGDGDATCSAAPVFTSTVPVNPDGSARSSRYKPTAPGTYRWVASYSGDGANNPASGACNDDDASLTVNVAASPLLCGGTKIALVDVFPEDGRTIISGVAQPRFAGQKARIVLRETGKTVIRTKIAGNGTFAASAALPPRSLRRNARYVAMIDGAKSAALKLQRRSYMTRAAVRGDSLTFAGRVTGDFKAGAKVTLQQIVLCTQKTAVASTRLKRNGTFEITMPATPNAMSVLFRAKTTVLNYDKAETTFTLPRPLSVSSAR
jgi:hypothetical protein